VAPTSSEIAGEIDQVDADAELTKMIGIAELVGAGVWQHRLSRSRRVACEAGAPRATCRGGKLDVAGSLGRMDSFTRSKIVRAAAYKGFADARLLLAVGYVVVLRD
jgi:hypothetical protein